MRQSDLLERGIRLIGVKGPSGSGKTKATSVMRECFPQSVVLPGDHYLVKAPVVNKKLAKNIFGRTFENEKELLDYFYQNESTEMLEKWNILVFLTNI